MALNGPEALPGLYFAVYSTCSWGATRASTQDITVLSKRDNCHIFPPHFLQQMCEIPTLIGSPEDIYWTPAAVPPVSCHVRPAFLDTFCPVGMAVPFPEIEIQSKFGQAAQTQQEPFKSGKQKE